MFTVYGMPGCQYCKKAVELLEQSGEEFVYHDVMESIEERNKMLEALVVVRTLPQIFKDKEHIGGFNELKQIL